MGGTSGPIIGLLYKHTIYHHAEHEKCPTIIVISSILESLRCRIVNKYGTFGSANVYKLKHIEHCNFFEKMAKKYILDPTCIGRPNVKTWYCFNYWPKVSQIFNWFFWEKNLFLALKVFTTQRFAPPLNNICQLWSPYLKID